MKMRMIMIFGLLTVVAGVAPAQSPPDSPPGYRWEVNEDLTDEFNGTTLDKAKWHDHNPKWAGRKPGKFVPSAVSVKDGYLQIQCTPLDRPENGYTIACGAVQSKSREALYGYYECRMKASRLTTSTVFWMAGDTVEIPGGSLKQELLIQLTIGNSKQFKSQMKSNAMSALQRSGEERQKVKATGRAELKSGVADKFHTYGCWWIDANTMKFYADGIHVYTINPSTEFDAKPFRHPLAIILNCATFDWQPLPSDSELRDPDRNTAYFDYVRAYKLVKDD
ncbi:MAG: family 16 glycosylhydrolase [Verrucomicrobiota bacterium]